jgi:hypothetical protein
MSKQPTAMQMIKMMSNTQLREAAKDFREELKKAGVEFSQEVRYEVRFQFSVP